MFCIIIQSPCTLQLVAVTRIVKPAGTDRGSVMKTGTRGPDGNIIKAEGRFTNTAVPRFNGDGCWQQYLQIVHAIVNSNGWTDATVALNLFAHLGGGGALLMPEGERANWECLSQGILAVFWCQFESATRRLGMDPAIATEFEILAVRRFGDMGKRARDWMIRDRFIAAQRSCGLRRHLNGVPPDTPIRDIVNHYQV